MKPFIVTVMIFCGIYSASAQGMYWQSTTDGMGGKHTEECYAMPNMFKMVRSGETGKKGSVIIFRTDKQLMWMINPDEKTYSEMTFDDMQKMMEKNAEQMEAMKERMKNMPEEQRKMMEKMMGSSDQPLEVKKTEETKTVTGHTCTKVLVLRGDEEFMTLWVADDLKEFRPLMADWKSFSEHMSQMTARFGNGMLDVYKKIDGFPMETEVSIMGQTMTTTVTKVEEHSTPKSAFEVPEGFTKVKSPLEEASEKMEKEQPSH
jgi:Domain of unknown function (DUF4412)